MKLYLYDMTWRGALIAVADSRETALQLMIVNNKGDPLVNYGSCVLAEDLTELELPPTGMCIRTVGDA